MKMNTKRNGRLRRAKRCRGMIKRQPGVARLCVYRSTNHIYAQLITPCGGKVLAQASTLETAVKEQHNYGGNKTAATAVGKLIAERALKAGVNKVAFDRSGFRYHGRVQALADAARDGGIEF